MEISLLCLMECAHSNPKELQPYEAESEGCFEGSVADALKIILHLSLRKHDAMESAGDSFRNLSIQGPEMDEDASFLCCVNDLSIQDDGVSEPSPTAGKSDSIPRTPPKWSAPSIADQQEPIEDEPVDQEPLLALQDPLVLSPSRRLRSKTSEADVSMVFKRNRNYCQAEDCVFSRTMPGQPALCRDGNCAWCDPDAMASAIADGGAALRNVRISLSMFEEKNTACPPASL